MTSQRQRLAYARVCIEIDKQSTFPSTVEVMDFNGKTFNQAVEYEWVPTVCESCKQLGHKANQCTKNTRHEWRPIPKPKLDTKPADVQQAPIGNVTTTVTNPETPTNSHDHEEPPPQRDQKESESEQSTASTNVELKNLSSCIVEFHEVTPIAISPLAIEEPTFSPTPLLQYHNNELEVSSTEVDHSTPPSYNQQESTNDELAEFQLSKSQRKKRAKMLHAMMLQGKATQAKPAHPSPNHQ